MQFAHNGSYKGSIPFGLKWKCLIINGKLYYAAFYLISNKFTSWILYVLNK